MREKPFGITSNPDNSLTRAGSENDIATKFKRGINTAKVIINKIV